MSREVAQKKLDFLKNAEEAPIVDVPDAICHADFHIKNVLHDQDMNVVGIIDWDNTGLANPYLDFWNTFYNSVCSSTFQEATEQLALSKAFITGYEAGSGKLLDLKALEDSLESFIQERTGSTWPMYQHYYEHDTKNDHKLAGIANRTEGMPKKRDTIFNLLQSTVLS